MGIVDHGRSGSMGPTAEREIRHHGTIVRRRRRLDFGLRVTVIVRETSEDAWRAARDKLGGWNGVIDKRVEVNWTGKGSVGQARLTQLLEVGEVLDRCLCTAPARVGNGAGSTWGHRLDVSPNGALDMPSTW